MRAYIQFFTPRIVETPVGRAYFPCGLLVFLDWQGPEGTEANYVEIGRYGGGEAITLRVDDRPRLISYSAIGDDIAAWKSGPSLCGPALWRHVEEMVAGKVDDMRGFELEPQQLSSCEAAWAEFQQAAQDGTVRAMPPTAEELHRDRVFRVFTELAGSKFDED